MRHRIDGLPSNIRLIEPLGQGATSTVWKARDRSAGTDVAVKVVPRRSTRRRIDAERVERESRALSRLGSHPGIAEVRSLGVNPDSAWVVTTLVPGGSLDSAMRRGPITLTEILGIGATAADALVHAHARGVVHGDVTPSNVLLRADGGAVLADFGLASLGDVGTGVDGSAADGLTPAFAAPERRQGGPIDPPSDVYGLGATLWAASTGSAPPRAGAPTPPDMPSGLASILRSCTESDPARRPTAEHAARMFRREQLRCGYAVTEDVVPDGAPNPVRPRGARRFASTRLLLAVLVIVAVALVVIGTSLLIV